MNEHCREAMLRECYLNEWPDISQNGYELKTNLIHFRTLYVEEPIAVQRSNGHYTVDF